MSVLVSFFYLFALYGLTTVLIYGDGPFEIISRFRTRMNETLPSNLGELFTCPLCLPTNLGWIFSLINWFCFPSVPFTPFNIAFSGTGLWFLAMILDMGIAAGFCWLMHFLDEFLASGAEMREKMSDTAEIYNKGYTEGYAAGYDEASGKLNTREEIVDE